MRHSWSIRIAVTLLPLAALAAWCNSFRGPFVLDDLPTIIANPSIRRLGSLSAVLSPPKMGLTVTGRPLVNLTLALNYAMSGTQVWSYHALNLVIHVLAGLTLFGIVRRTLLLPSCRSLLAGGPLVSAGCDRGPPPQRTVTAAIDDAALQSNTTLLAFATAVLWIVHPLQTEAVTYVVQRAESLMGLFYLLTLYFLVRGVDSEKSPRAWCWFLFSVLACLLGMATKEVMVSAPIIVFLYDRTFVAGGFAEAWRRRRRYYSGLAVTWLLLGWLVLGTAGRGGTAGLGTSVPWWSYALTQCQAIIHYLQLSVWPHPLVFDYGTSVVHSWVDVWWQTTAVLALLGLAIWASISKPRCGFLAAWFFLILAPSSSIVPVVTQTMAEHRMYLSLAAVIVGGVVGLHVLLQQLQNRVLRVWLPWSGGFFPLNPAILVLTLVLPLAWLTARRNEVYRSELALWTDTVAHEPDSERAHTNLGNAMLWSGRVPEAIRQYEVALRIRPGAANARINLTAALLQTGRPAEALIQGEVVLRLDPNDTDAHVNVGNALAQLGRTDEAIAHFKTALRLQPDAADAHFQLGTAFLKSGQPEAAIQHYEEALRLQPDRAETHLALADVFAQVGNPLAAEREYSEAVRLKPDYLEAHLALADLCAGADRFTEAIVHYEQVVRLDPTQIAARANLGNALLVTRRIKEAIAAYEAALRLQPDNARIRQNLEIAEGLLNGDSRTAPAQ